MASFRWIPVTVVLACLQFLPHTDSRIAAGAWLGGSRSAAADGQSFVYLPAVHVPKTGLYGSILLRGAPAAGEWVSLRRWREEMWSDIAFATTDIDGAYHIPHPPSLAPGERYHVRYGNGNAYSEFVSEWYSRDLTAYVADAPVNLGTFDIANIMPISPPDGAQVRVPQTFQWTTRDQHPDETYGLFIYSKDNKHPPFYTGSLGHVDRYTLSDLPPGIRTDYVMSNWQVVILDSESGYGLNSQAPAFWFTEAEQTAESALDGASFRPAEPVDWLPQWPLEWVVATDQ